MFVVYIGDQVYIYKPINLMSRIMDCSNSPCENVASCHIYNMSLLLILIFLYINYNMLR